MLWAEASSTQIILHHFNPYKYLQKLYIQFQNVDIGGYKVRRCVPATSRSTEHLRSFTSGLDERGLVEVAFYSFLPKSNEQHCLYRVLPLATTVTMVTPGPSYSTVERKWAHARLHTEKWSVRALHGRLHWLSRTLSELQADRLTQWQEVHNAPHVYCQNKQEPGGAWEFKKTHNSNTHQPRHLIFLYSINLCIHLLTDGQALSLGWLSFIGLF